MAARISELRDAAVSVIEAAASVSPISGTTIDVSAAVALGVDPAELSAGTMLVQVRAGGYADGGPASRGVDITDYRIQVAVIECYGDAGEVPTDWLDERLDWFDTCVIRSLGNARERLDGAYALSLSDVEIDEDELQDKWLVWLQSEIVFRDERVV